MSHIVKVAVKMMDKEALQAACDHLSIKTEGWGKHTVFNNSLEGLSVRLPGFHYPVVINEAGDAVYDNYQEKWGNVIEVDKLVQRYTVELAAREMRIAGYEATEEVLENGDVRLVCNDYNS